MTELCFDFASQAEWDQWHGLHSPRFGQIRDAILLGVRTQGLIEPITGIHRRPEQIEIDPGHILESIAAAQLNSRKRALLLEIDQILRRMPALATPRIRIFAPEAVTRTALIFRGRYPYFLGSEYLPAPADRARHFPIPHVDLQDTGLPDESFDLTFSGDVFEHIPDLPAALRECHRILKPGGMLVATCPFDEGNAVTDVRAEIVDGNIRHRAEPEYHRNPVDPAGGSLVFSIPGWDILSTLEQIGFAWANMTLLASARAGVTSDVIPGALVLNAQKRATTPTPRPCRRRMNLGPADVPAAGNAASLHSDHA